MTSLQEIYDSYVRPMNLSWRLGDASRRRLVLATALPALVVGAQLTQVVLAYVFSRAELLYGDEFGGPGEFWERLNRAAAVVVDTLLPVAIAVLFLIAIRRWTRVEGSWMLLIGAALATLAALFGGMTTLVYIATEDFELISDLGADLWPDVARTFGFLSIGFFFVAYGALAPGRSRQRSPEAPSSAPPEA